MAAPVTPTLDNFNRADGAPGANWVPIFPAYSVPNIVSNALDWPQFPSAAWNTSFSADQEGWAVVNNVDVTLSTGVNITLRMNNLNTGNESGYRLTADPSTNGGLGPAEILRVDAGTSTSLVFSNGVTPMFNASQWYIWGSAIGSTLSIYVSQDNVSWTLCLSTTDSTYSGSGYTGMFFGNNGNPGSIDSYGGGNIINPPLLGKPAEVNAGFHPVFGPF